MDSCRASPADTQQALAQAETLCQQRGVRLTDLRRRVLEIIWNSTAPLGAYAILDVLREDGRQGASAPPTVYRALDFLLEQGLIHRLVSLNVFTVCHQPGKPHNGQFLICQDCGHVNEMNNPEIDHLLRTETEGRGFETRTRIVEILGRCPECLEESTRYA